MFNEEEAYSKCIDLAYNHYENFPVAKLVPKEMRKHVAAVYAFARTADDIADEEHESIAEDDPIRIERLEHFEAQLDVENLQDLDESYAWIFIALKQTIKECKIPTQLCRDLISAFKQDVVKKRYEDFDDLLDYCRRSADPVGRLVLLLHKVDDQNLFLLSDKICSALQLANFWQDMSVDKLKNRIYIPKSDWQGLSDEDFFKASSSQDVRDIVKYQVDRTQKMFEEGSQLIKHLKFPLSLEIKITVAGGMAILSKIRSQNYDTLIKRPSLNKIDKVKLLLKGLFL